MRPFSIESAISDCVDKCSEDLNALEYCKIVEVRVDVIEMDWRYCWNLVQARVCFAEVAGSTAFFEAVSAACRSTRKLFLLEDSIF
jgi:hypothetical protein